MNQSKKRPNNYYLETYIAVKEGIGSPLNEIGRKVAFSLEEEDLIEFSPKNESGFKLKSSFKKKIENNLKNLWNDGKVFKQYFDKEGAILQEEEIQTMTGSQYRVFYYPTMAKSQVLNEGLLTLAGVNIIPLSKSLFFKCREMTDYISEPVKHSAILFVNDYRRGIFLEFEHLDLPITFCVAHKRQNINQFIEICKNKLIKEELPSERVALVLLENTNYDFKTLPSDQFLAISFLSKNEIIYQNFTEGPFEIGSDITEVIYDDLNTYINRKHQHENDIKALTEAGKIKARKDFEFSLKTEGFAKETKLLKPGGRTENMSFYSPTNIEILNYVIVNFLGKED